MSSLPIVAVASRDQLPQLRAFAASAVEQGIDAGLTAFVVDDPSLSVPHREARGLRLEPVPAVPEFHCLRLLCRTGPELARAVTPAVAAEVLARRRTALAVLSPATWVAGPLDILEAPAENPVSLVPTRLAVRAGDPFEQGFQRNCLIVRPGADPFLRWWSARETDRLLDLVGPWGLEEAAASTPHTILRDPGIGVDAWNAAERVDAAGEGLVVSGGPLRTFHFDEFDPRRPHLAVGTPKIDPPVLLSAQPFLRRLHTRYASLVLENGYEQAVALPYTWGVLPGGLSVDDATRHAYRTALQAHRRGRGPEPPDPFTAEGVSRFVEFLNEPAPDIARTYSRYVWALYETWPDLTVRLPARHVRRSRPLRLVAEPVRREPTARSPR